jgi:hypothetical protein
MRAGGVPAAAVAIVGASDGFFYFYVICTSSQVQVGIQYTWRQVTFGDRLQHDRQTDA